MADVDVPKVGKVNKKVLIPIGVAAAGFIGWRYWIARNTVSDPVDPGMEDPGMIPGVIGGVKPDNSYGSGDQGGNPQQTGGFRGTTNSQWTEYVTERLQQSDRWSYTTIVTALGNYLAGKPLSSEQQDIARAAIGLAGNPPVGNPIVIPGGNTAITVAPTGLAVTAKPDSLTVTFQPVAGAVTYNGFISGSARATSNGTTMTFTGLTPGTSYSVQVAAVSGSGAVGPKSTAISAKTTAVTMGTPAKPTVSSVVGSNVTFKTSTVPYATSYRWFLNGKIYNTTDGPWMTATNLKPKARYSPGFSVQADSSTALPGKVSAATSFTTK